MNSELTVGIYGKKERVNSDGFYDIPNTGVDIPLMRLN